MLNNIQTRGRFISGFAYCLLLAVCCFVGACASSGDFELLRQDVDRLQRDHGTTKGEVENLKEKTKSVATEESVNAMRMNQADMQSQLSNLARDIQVLSGRFDENKYSTEKTLKDWTSEMDVMKAQIVAMERQIKEMKDKYAAYEGQAKLQKEPAQEKETEKKAEEHLKETMPKEEQASKSASASDRLTKYEAAYSAFKSKRYKDAREKFEAYLKEYPGDELTDNAYFWVAETYYNEKDYEEAILSYETLLKKYPNSKKAAGALLKQGLSFVHINDKKTGKAILDQLIERFPKAKEAELARKEIEDLNKKPSKKKK